jgi:hypothetical protein
MESKGNAHLHAAIAMPGDMLDIENQEQSGL